MPVEYNINNQSLENNFKEMQKVLHPDKYSTASESDKEISAVSSSTINQAYQALKSPIDRAEYLLNLHGAEGIKEANITHDPELMAEMFELREAIAEADSIQNMKALSNETMKKMEGLFALLKKTFEKKNFVEACKISMKLKYLSKAVEELDEMIFKQENRQPN